MSAQELQPDPSQWIVLTSTESGIMRVSPARESIVKPVDCGMDEWRRTINRAVCQDEDVVVPLGVLARAMLCPRERSPLARSLFDCLGPNSKELIKKVAENIGINDGQASRPNARQQAASQQFTRA